MVNAAFRQMGLCEHLLVIEFLQFPVCVCVCVCVCMYVCMYVCVRVELGLGFWNLAGGIIV